MVVSPYKYFNHGLLPLILGHMVDGYGDPCISLAFASTDVIYDVLTEGRLNNAVELEANHTETDVLPLPREVHHEDMTTNS